MLLLAPRTLCAILLTAAATAFAADPTFLKRSIAAASPQADELTAGATGAVYRPLFGAGDPQARHLKSIARYGELTIEAAGKSALVSYPAEEQVYFILSGTGAVLCDGVTQGVKPNDFLYLPPGSKHGVVNTSSAPLHVLVMGFRLPGGNIVPPARRLMIANTADVPLQQLASHGPTTQFKLLMGTTESKRDKLPAASQMVSLFVMDFAPGGTNIPHHHETEEEIYFILQGSGELVAGGGIDGNEGRHPTRQGDAWFLRLNTTVGFYSGAQPGGAHDLVLAVRSSFPFPPTRRPQ
ncbi:cupin domain-containing protein [Paludibaculum fermentans]|uniref:Cupin domain-containing protein n=1 Tax=Paludibaculum fermentans TaxID=1473598 RepID=A0A7S7NT86_PALFE|nr:cupin domain-containing protein [Paludibaculum fermentans]QOY89390.1 cupin domain-containing protein [Paludibaculum fermentans]